MRPKIYENSKVPVILSYLSPVSWVNWLQGKSTFEIWGITILWFIFIRGEANDSTIRHETIHVLQGSETFFIGFYALYIWDWISGLIKYKDADIAYKMIRAEQEAYEFDNDPNYLSVRKPKEWIHKYRV